MPRWIRPAFSARDILQFSDVAILDIEQAFESFGLGYFELLSDGTSSAYHVVDMALASPGYLGDVLLVLPGPEDDIYFVLVDFYQAPPVASG